MSGQQALGMAVAAVAELWRCQVVRLKRHFSVNTLSLRLSLVLMLGHFEVRSCWSEPLFFLRVLEFRFLLLFPSRLISTEADLAGYLPIKWLFLLKLLELMFLVCLVSHRPSTLPVNWPLVMFLAL